MPVEAVVNLAEFKGRLESAGEGVLVAVDFSAAWCGPCRMISPKFEEMAVEFTRAVFLKVDVDEASDVAEVYKIQCMPTFLFFKNGEKVDEFSGANEQKLRAMINKLV
ncbi:thioredoxin-like [Sycon ciliatum]|uniref:thioredoxin-like n=1 Tax=Sycon ciliatum TaxID=27933 RepID=UPI0031F6BDD8